MEIPRTNWNEVHLHLFSSNLRAMHILRSSLCDDVYAKISSCLNAHDIWNSLNSIYGSNNCGVVDVCANCEETFSHQQEGYEAKVESSQCCTINGNACLIDFVDEEEEAQSRRVRSMECSTSSSSSVQLNEDDVNEVTSNLSTSKFDYINDNDDVLSFDELLNGYMVIHNDLENANKEKKIFENQIDDLKDKIKILQNEIFSLTLSKNVLQKDKDEFKKKISRF